MARPPAPEGKEPALEPGGLPRRVRAGTPAPVYLLDGDAFLTLRAAREHRRRAGPGGAALPQPGGAGRAPPRPAEVAAELATGGLFGGAQGGARGRSRPSSSRRRTSPAPSRKASDMWREGRQREAARRLLALAAQAGWSTADLAAATSPPTVRRSGRRSSRATIGCGRRTAAFVAEAGRYAGEKNLKAAQGRHLRPRGAPRERGCPPGHVLVVAAGKVDGRLPLVKRLAAAGLPDRGGRPERGDLGRAAAGARPAARRDCSPGTGKTVDRGRRGAAGGAGGRRRPRARRRGGEARGLRRRPQGDRRRRRGRGGDPHRRRPVLRARQRRRGPRPRRRRWRCCDRSLADGASPHMLVGSLAGTVRRLLVERERARMAAGGRRVGSFAEWRRQVLPAIDPRTSWRSASPTGSG